MPARRRLQFLVIFFVVKFNIQLVFIEQNDRIFDAMKSFDWHLLPHHLQKNYQIMLHHIDQPRNIFIAGISQLSLETSVVVSIGILNGLCSLKDLVYVFFFL